MTQWTDVPDYSEVSKQLAELWPNEKKVYHFDKSVNELKYLTPDSSPIVDDEVLQNRVNEKILFAVHEANKKTDRKIKILEDKIDKLLEVLRLVENENNQDILERVFSVLQIIRGTDYILDSSGQRVHCQSFDDIKELFLNYKRKQCQE